MLFQSFKAGVKDMSKELGDKLDNPTPKSKPLT
jgi:hypothetical protein